MLRQKAKPAFTYADDNVLYIYLSFILLWNLVFRLKLKYFFPNSSNFADLIYSELMLSKLISKKSQDYRQKNTVTSFE